MDDVVSRKQALMDLLEKVEAGGMPVTWRVFDCDEMIMSFVHNAFHGSLDAAKELHEVVLPGWGWRKDHWDGSDLPGHETWWVTEPGNWRVGQTCQYIDKNDARAWLIAIIKGLIVIEESKDE